MKLSDAIRKGYEHPDVVMTTHRGSFMRTVEQNGEPPYLCCPLTAACIGDGVEPHTLWIGGGMEITAQVREHWPELTRQHSQIIITMVDTGGKTWEEVIAEVESWGL